MTDYLFNTPWWLPVAIAAAGVMVFVSANKRQEVRVRNAGLVIIFLAAVLTAVSYFVDTDVEKALARTTQVVKAIDDEDWATFERLLDPEVSFAIYFNREQLVRGARDSSQKFGLRTARVMARSAEQEDDAVIYVNFSAYSEQNLPPYPLTSKWRFEWRPSGDEWLLYRIEAVEIGNRPADNLNGQLPPKR